jgi:uncharacterized protein involved in exopolysaccharide biosynthesis
MRSLVRLAVTAILLATPSLVFGQSGGTDPVRSSAAYAEVLLRKTEIMADIEALSADYTEANPRMLDLRVETASLDRAFEKLMAVRPAEAGKLTLALGKLLVRRAALETDLDRLSRSYAKDHPEVKRAKRRVEIFDAAIKEVLK